MGNTILLASSTDIDFMIKGVFSYQIFGQTAWITTTHICVLIIILAMSSFCIAANKVMKKADEIPGGFQNVLELIVDMLDGLIDGTMGKFAPGFRNYIGTVFVFIWLCNTSGLFGLRAPTADFGITLGLALGTFTVIHYAELKFNKLSGFAKNLIKPVPFLLPINIISKISTPISLSLRLFANNLSGIILLSLVYGLLSMFAFVWPAFLHAFFDVFIGSLQAYVFCVLSMTYIRNACVGN